MREIPPENLVDRSIELDEFASILRFQGDARLLAICDAEGTGKTELLRILEYNCKYRFHPRVHVSRVVLDDEEITDAFSFVRRVREQLRKSPFPHFDYFDSARLNHYWAPFAPAAPRSARSETYAAHFNLREAEIQGTPRFTGVSIEAGGGPVLVQKAEGFPSSPQWASPDQEPKARERCVEAFLEDLRDLSNEQPIVLLIDAFEKAPRRDPGLETWLVDDVAWPLCVEENRPRSFVLVIAGRKIPNLAARLPPDRTGVVASRDSLTWEDEHVRDFLALHGYGGLSEDDVTLVCERVRLGFSISRALRLAEVLAPSGGA